MQLDGSVHKRYRSGTHRSCSAEATVERVGRVAPALGITRVADVTGLDAIGIPVVMVCRPNSRSLSVSQGKGVSLDAAKASGLMEALELFHAERIGASLRLASYDELALKGNVVDPNRLARTRFSRFHEHLRILWIEAADLVSDRSTWLPLELMHLDCTPPALPGAGSFFGSSSGLASGNDRWEATIHAICEVLERDGLGRFEELAPEEQDRRRIRLSTVDDHTCCWLLERYEKARCSVAVWDTSGPADLASFLCGIAIADDRSGSAARLYYGMGCHPDRGIALSRALTEAAQARLTMITGSRDDAGRQVYARDADADRIAQDRERFDRVSPELDFHRVATWTSDDLAEDGRWVLQRMSSTPGFGEVLAVDLTIPGLDVPVVYVVVPGAKSMGGFVAPSCDSP